MQSDVAVGTNAITGTLAFIEGGLSPAGYLSGDGHFLALKFSTADWADFDKVEVGLDPSQGSGLVDVLPDPDKNGVFKITSTSQKFIVKTTAGEDIVTKEYSLAGLVLSPEHIGPFFDKLYLYRGNEPNLIDGEAGVTTYELEYGDEGQRTDTVQVRMNTNDYTLTSYEMNGESQSLPSKNSPSEYANYYSYDLKFKKHSGDEIGGDIDFTLEDQNGNSIDYAVYVSYTADVPARQMGEVSDGQDLDIYIEDGVYTYEGDLDSASGTLTLETADVDCVITAIELNEESVQVPTPVDNIYTLSYSGLTSGVNTIVISTRNIETQDEMTYYFNITYSGE